MKAGTKIWIGFLIVSLFASLEISAQGVEYDDLYFNKSDRKAKKEKKYKPVSSDENVIKSDVPLTTEEFSSKNINPEYIARYKADELENETDEHEYSTDDYYVDSDERINDNQQEYLDSTKYSSNYNRPDYYRYPNHSAYNRYGYGLNPYYCPPGWNFGLGYTLGSFYGMPYSGYNFSMSWSTGGYGYYPYSSWYDPWYDPWYGGFGYPSYASAWRFGFGMGYYNSFYNPYYYPYHNHYVIINEGSNYNNYHYGRRDSRTSTSLTSRNYSQNRLQSSSPSKNIKVDNASANRSTRDYSKLQNEYYRNSRSTSSVIDRSNYDSRSLNNNRSSYTDRISSSSSKVSNNNTYTSRPSRSSSYTERSNSGRTSGYTTPSRSSSNYTAPSRSRSSYNNNSSRPSSSGSRSSSYSSGSSSGSRSSYTPSRSSSSSSSSRSSSSSSSGRRR